MVNIRSMNTAIQRGNSYLAVHSRQPKTQWISKGVCVIIASPKKLVRIASESHKTHACKSCKFDKKMYLKISKL